MKSDVTIPQQFRSEVARQVPELTSSLKDSPLDEYGSFVLLEATSPSFPTRCRLGAIFREGSFEVTFDVADARGPAEAVFPIENDPDGVIASAIDYLRMILSGRILVDVFRYRFLWYPPYYLAFFRDAEARPKRNVHETLYWKARESPLTP